MSNHDNKSVFKNVVSNLANKNRRPELHSYSLKKVTVEIENLKSISLIDQIQHF